MQCFAQKLGAINPKRLRPLLGFGCLGLGNPKTEHCHTEMLTRMTDSRSSNREQVTLEEVELVGDERLMHGPVVDVEVVDAGVGP
jgi:hypothetical protein